MSAMSLKVAVINKHPEDVVGGSELQADLFARGLALRGHEVTFLALWSRGRTGAAENPSAESYPYRLRPLDAATSATPDGIAAAVQEVGADVVYWRAGREGLDGVARRLARSPRRIALVLAVAHVNDVSRWPTTPPARLGVRHLAADLRRRVAHRRSWRAFDDIAAVAAQREDFLGRVPVPLQRYIPNVVDPTMLPFTWPRPYVAWVANIKPRKRPELLVPLARALAPHGVDLLVVGGVQDERFAALSRPMPDVPNLHPLGLRTPAVTAGVIAGARCMAVTFRPEGLSNAMLQAWWHGVPTVSLDYDPDGIVGTRALGAVCEGDVGRFHDEVIRHATDDAVRGPAGERAASFAQERFALDTNVSALEALLRETVASAG